MVFFKNNTESRKRISSVTENVPSTRPKKRQKVDESDFLKQLKGLTSDQLIKFRKSHDLTDVQERELKVHTRKIKNRESAIQSRQRRKAHQDELEEKMKRLTSENKQLEKRVIRLEAQSDILKKEYMDFQKMISSSSGLNLLWRGGNTNPRLQHAEENPRLQYASSNEVPETEPVSESVGVEDSNTSTSISTKSSEDLMALFSVLVMMQAIAPHFNTVAPLLTKALLATQNNSLNSALSV